MSLSWGLACTLLAFAKANITATKSTYGTFGQPKGMVNGFAPFGTWNIDRIDGCGQCSISIWMLEAVARNLVPFSHTQLRTVFSAADDDESDDTCAGPAGELGVMRSVPSVATWFILISGKI